MAVFRRLVFFFFQAEDGIRDYKVTGVQTCALPISRSARRSPSASVARVSRPMRASGAPSSPSTRRRSSRSSKPCGARWPSSRSGWILPSACSRSIARASAWRRRAAHESRSRGRPHPRRRGRRVLRLDDRPRREQGIRGQAQDANRGAACRWSGGRARGAGGAAARGGGTRGASRFYGAFAGQGAGRGGGETRLRRKAYGVHVIQYPPLPPAPDLNYVIHQLSPFVGLILMFVGVRWVLRSTGIGEAVAERIRQRSRAHWGVAGEDPQRVAALEQQVSQLQGQVSELAERIDFAERMLADRREPKLGAGQWRPPSTPRALKGNFD